MLFSEWRKAMEYGAYVIGLEAKRRFTGEGYEYWMARELANLLGYSAWRNFRGVIDKAKEACTTAGIEKGNHFVETDNMVAIGSGVERGREDWFLSRYACYLVAMNAEPSKEEVGHAMSYFAIQTRKQELTERAVTDADRLNLRLRVMDNNSRLAGAAKQAGVQRYPIFQDAGYRGLYGMGLSDVKTHKGIGKDDDLLDRAGRLELAANDFRITLTEERLNRDRVSTENTAIQTHRQVGNEVRETMVRNNGVQPEDLPLERSIRPLIQQHKKRLKASKKS